MKSKNKGRGFTPRVVTDVTTTHGQVITNFLDSLMEGVDDNDPASLLRAYQNLVTGSRAAMLEFERRTGEQYHRAIVQKFRSDTERLWNAGFLQGYTRNLDEALTKQERLEKSIIGYFEKSHYHVGRSQSYAVPVCPEGYIDEQIECLREVLERSGMSAVEVSEDFICNVSDEFLVQYPEREVCNRKRPPAHFYALCGVHGGKDTPDHSAKDSLEYFELHNRLALTFKEALSLYTAHPRFLREQERVVLLGEQYPSGKYAFIASPQKGRLLSIGLTSLDAADEIYLPATHSPHCFHGGNPLPRYGKPSAAAQVADTHL